MNIDIVEFHQWPIKILVRGEYFDRKKTAKNFKKFISDEKIVLKSEISPHSIKLYSFEGELETYWKKSLRSNG